MNDLKELINDCRGSTLKDWLVTGATFVCVIIMSISFCVIAEMLTP